MMLEVPILESATHIQADHKQQILFLLVMLSVLQTD